MYLLGSSDNYILGTDNYVYSPVAPRITLTATTLVYSPGQSLESANKILLEAELFNIPPATVSFQVRDAGSDQWQEFASDSTIPYSAGYLTSYMPDGAAKIFRASVYLDGQFVYSEEVTAFVNNAPTVTLSAPTGVQYGPFNIQVSFSEPVTGITASSFQLTNDAVAASISGSGAQYVLTINPPVQRSGEISIQLPAGSGQDAGGNTTTAMNDELGGVRQIAVQFDTTQVVTNPQVLSIGGDNIVTPGETATIAVQDIALGTIDQVVLAGNGGEYSIPFNGSPMVTIPTYMPAGTYTLILRRFN